MKKYTKDYLSKMTNVELVLAHGELNKQVTDVDVNQTAVAVKALLLAEYELLNRMR